MNRLFGLCLCAVALLVCAAHGSAIGSPAADPTARVFINEREHRLKPPAIIREGRAYVSIRAAGKALNACVKWNALTGVATVTVGNKRARVAKSDGIVVNGALYLPLKATGEVVGSTVEWDSVRRAVKITTEAPCPTGGG